MTPQPDPDTQQKAKPKDKTSGANSQSHNLQVCLQLFGATLVILNTWGIINTFGVFQSFYETDLLHQYSPSAISWIGTVQTFLVEIVGVITGPFFDHGHFYPMLCLGCLLVVSGTMMQSLASQYWQIMLAQGLCIGIGGGMIFVPSIAVASEAVSEKRRSLAISVVTSSSGLGGVIFPILFSRLQPRIGFPWTVRVMAFIALGAFAIPLITFRSARTAAGPKKIRSLIDTSAFREPAFVVYVAALFLIFLAFFVPYFYISSFATTTLHTSDEFALDLLSIMNAAGVLGRLLPGVLTARGGGMECFIGATGCAGILAFAWMGIHNLPGLIVFAIIYGALSGAILTLTAVMIVSLSAASPHLTGTRLGMGYAGIGVGILIGSPIAAAVTDTTNGEFVGAQAWCGGMLLAGGGLSLYPWYEVRKQQRLAGREEGSRDTSIDS